jgi:hypothetical protein
MKYFFAQGSWNGPQMSINPFKNRLHLSPSSQGAKEVQESTSSQKVDSEVDKIFEEFDLAVELYDRKLPGPYKLTGEYSLAAFERFRELSHDHWLFCYVDDHKLIVCFGDTSTPHQGCANYLTEDIMLQLKSWIRRGPPTGDALLDSLLASSDFNRSLIFNSCYGVLRGMTDDESHPFLGLKPIPGQVRSGVVRKELDIDISVMSRLMANPLVAGR